LTDTVEWRNCTASPADCTSMCVPVRSVRRHRGAARFQEMQLRTTAGGLVRVVGFRVHSPRPLPVDFHTLTDKSVGLGRKIGDDYSADRDVVGSIPSDIDQFSNLERLYAHTNSLSSVRGGDLRPAPAKSRC